MATKKRAAWGSKTRHGQPVKAVHSRVKPVKVKAKTLDPSVRKELLRRFDIFLELVDFN